jgi:hypothetical protein
MRAAAITDAMSQSTLSRAQTPSPAAIPSRKADSLVARRRWFVSARETSPMAAIQTETPPLSKTVRSR